MLQKRHNQLLHGFDFWGEPQLRDTKNIYELRTYHLKVYLSQLSQNLTVVLIGSI